MKAFNGYNETKVLSEKPKLPVGAYECVIIDAQEIEIKDDNGNTLYSKLHIAIDISEGEYKGFYTKQHQQDKRSDEDAKYKGILRLYIPTDDGSDSDNFTKSIFKTATTAIEESNNGYHWDWNERGLKDKKVGCVFRDEQWGMDNGNQGWKAQPFKFISLANLKDGKFKIPQPKAHKNAIYNEPSPSAANDIGAFEEVTDEDCPF